MHRLLCLLSLTLISCSRPLTETEAAFARYVHGAGLDTARVRITRDVPLGVATFEYKKRPRLACRERINPEPKEEVITASPAGVVLFNRLFTTEGWSVPNYVPDYPEKLHMSAALFFAHEMTHIWQWQNREITGYSPRRAASEHKRGVDPYQFETASAETFLDYGYEQQAAVVEEYLCCAILDPEAPRTTRLRALLDDHFPVDDLPRLESVILPWDGAELEGICR
ncbi:hypothetical protein [Shimia sp. MMG029]|uniref:hypothetical protein n=1 Tax=Shimia sp. MMG029 TaxID=3021978 RepID=UPI0022FE9F62|nr:hypothetical protein [Shimia sp. MMG029]MDA5556138.1 hypothetical protein [Shimia sp. MMG029]